MDYLLNDLKVIDAASFLAGPGAATVMADYGAQVIKVEPLSYRRNSCCRKVLSSVFSGLRCSRGSR